MWFGDEMINTILIVRGMFVLFFKELEFVQSE